MIQQDVPATTAGDAPPKPRYRGRHLPMVAVVVAAFIATALAYSGMVLFGLEVAHMSPLEAYALAGFLEVSLVAVALMARNAALEGRPYGVLLTLTWILSGTSGVFAALHEIAVPTESTPYMVVFRFVPPLVAALMWHLALVGERHLVTGHTLDERRREHRVHQYVTALESWRDARLDSTGNARGMRKVRRAHLKQRAARDGALKLLTVEDFERRMQVWVDRLEAAERHGNRLDTIGASSIKRGTSKGISPEAVAAAAAPARTAPSLGATAADAAIVAEAASAVRGAPERSESPQAPAAPAADRLPVRPSRGGASGAAAPTTSGTRAPAAAVEATQEDAEDEPFVDAFGAALLAERAVEEAATSAPEAPRRPLLEPRTETGHTRRVEVFDLYRGRQQAEAAAAQEAPAWHSVPEAPEAAAVGDVAGNGEREPAGAEETVEEDVARTLAAEAPTVEEGAGDAREGDETPAEAPTSDRDRRIVELAREGMTQREIAEEVSASRSTVSRVVRRYEDQKPRGDRDENLALAPA